MQQEPLENRVAALESQLADLKNRFESYQESQNNVGLALLARVDGFIDDLRRVERVQMRSFDELKNGQKTLESAVQGLAVGQQQIIELLTGGKSPRHD